MNLVENASTCPTIAQAGGERAPWRLAALSACAMLLVAAASRAADPPPQPAGVVTARPAAAAEQRVARHMERIRQEPPALRAFLQALPKGADLHTHLSGAVYAESYVTWAAELPLCIDLATLAFVDATGDVPEGASDAPLPRCTDPAGQRPAAQALEDLVLYRRVIDALSMRHWRSTSTTGHYQFFDAFQRFGVVARRGRAAPTGIVGRSVAEIMHRAGLQNVLHLELMMSFGADAGLASADAPWHAWETDAHFQGLRTRLLADGLQERVADRRRWLDGVEAETRAALGCGTPSAGPGCDVSVRFMPYALRGLPPHQVFAQALVAFELAAADPRIAGVNLVMPEDWHVPMRDYELHMRMYRFLAKAYPGVNVALHAGELAFGLVPPEQLGRHVRQAIEIGGARRIGHATDVMHDVDPAALLQDMARKRIAVEVSLSSSDMILGVSGPRHPLRQFLRAGVPVVIATDDEGVARSDLTNEYQRAVEEQGLTYVDLKAISFNGIDFSFLPAGEKARARQRLEAAFAAFEARYE